MAMTRAQRRALEWMRDYIGIFDGMAAQYSATLKMLRKMETLGLVRYVGHGEYEHGCQSVDYPIFNITEDGLAAIEEEIESFRESFRENPPEKSGTSKSS